MAPRKRKKKGKREKPLIERIPTRKLLASIRKDIRRTLRAASGKPKKK
ncbi:MAG: hypothetical protein ACE5HL_12080 [Terriglobia bacterium]